MAQGVQGQAVVHLGGGVPQMEGRQAVADLVDDKADEDGCHPQDHIPQIRPVDGLGELGQRAHGTSSFLRSDSPSIAVPETVPAAFLK